MTFCSGGRHDLTEGDPPLTAGGGLDVYPGMAKQAGPIHKPPAASGAPLGVRFLNVCELALVVGPLAVLTARGWWLA